MIKSIFFYNLILPIIALIAYPGCTNTNKAIEVRVIEKEVINDTINAMDSSTNNIVIVPIKELPIQTNQDDSIVAFAKTLIGIPYLYAASNPLNGFDCSGFITYVFNHFKIDVPRSSIGFTNYGKDVTKENAVVGNLILFTGTDSTSTVVGHMGIITENIKGKIHFIHSTSGKANGVTITPLTEYYKKRFVKIIELP
jgi:cell wall-associated NlpC family hydrolase